MNLKEKQFDHLFCTHVSVHLLVSHCQYLNAALGVASQGCSPALQPSMECCAKDGARHNKESCSALSL